jgi:FkbM family methyltransferase
MGAEGGMKTDGHWRLPDADTYFAGRLTVRGFEIEKLDAALAHVRQFRTAVDGGAHIGTWSAQLAGRFEDVIAFEPAPDTYACLERNVAGLPNVHTLRMALGACRRTGVMVDDPSRPGNTGARYLGEGSGCPVERLDELAIAHLDFLKLDLEGHEYFALLGAERTVKACRPVMVIEEKAFPGRYAVEPRAALDLLASWGAIVRQRIRSDVILSFD